jgi:hypothetical protein
MCWYFEPEKTREEYSKIIMEGFQLFDEEIFRDHNPDSDIFKLKTTEEILEHAARVSDYAKRHMRDLIVMLNMYENKNPFLVQETEVKHSRGDLFVLTDIFKLISFFDEEDHEWVINQIQIGDIFVFDEYLNVGDANSDFIPYIKIHQDTVERRSIYIAADEFEQCFVKMDKTI